MRFSIIKLNNKKFNNCSLSVPAKILSILYRHQFSQNFCHLVELFHCESKILHPDKLCYLKACIWVLFHVGKSANCQLSFRVVSQNYADLYISCSNKKSTLQESLHQGNNRTYVCNYFTLSYFSFIQSHPTVVFWCFYGTLQAFFCVCFFLGLATVPLPSVVGADMKHQGRCCSS